MLIDKYTRVLLFSRFSCCNPPGPFLRPAGPFIRLPASGSACAFSPVIPEMFGFPGPKEAAALRAERAAERVERGTTSVSRTLTASNAKLSSADSNLCPLPCSLSAFPGLPAPSRPDETSLIASAGDDPTESGWSRYFGFGKSIIVETDRHWLFLLRLIAGLTTLSMVMLDFVRVLSSSMARPTGWFFEVRFRIYPRHKL